ncbi:MAG: BrnT family toxin, partial [Gammaproteobacteria bacterium]|nr:BrnT family toxin [Gammaproteobacteria bacterium]
VGGARSAQIESASQAVPGIRKKTACLQCTYNVNTLRPCGSATSCRASRSNEPREAAVGYTEGEQLLFVVHVIRHEEIIRIVSAREATREERRQYENT